MSTILGNAVEALKGLFSRDFWLGTFPAVSLFAAAHLGIAVLAFGSSQPWLEKLVTAEGWPLVVLGLVVLSLALAPMVPLFRGLLDGSLLPAWLHDRLRKRRTERAARDRESVASDRDRLAQITRVVEKDYQTIQKAYQDALKRPGAAHDASICALEKALDAVTEASRTGGLPEVALLEAAIASRKAALLENNPDQDKAGEVGEKERARRLDEASNRLTDILYWVEREAQHRHNTAQTRLRGMDEDIVQATRLGDARRAAERYPFDAYGVHFGFLWPRLLDVLPREDGKSGLADRLSAAQAAVDFAALSIALTVSLPLVWLFVFLIYPPSRWWLVLLVGLGAPVLGRALFHLAVESQIAFGHAVRVAVDRHRLDVLSVLRQPVPMSRAAERALWRRLAFAEASDRLAEIPYELPPPKQVA